jgi:hypothetical protein
LYIKPSNGARGIMFSVGYNNKAMLISAIDVQRISFQNVEDLRRLVIQLLRNPCGKLVLDLQGIVAIDRPAIEIINRLQCLAAKQNVIVEYINVDKRVKSLFTAAGVALSESNIADRKIPEKTLRN